TTEKKKKEKKPRADRDRESSEWLAIQTMRKVLLLIAPLYLGLSNHAFQNERRMSLYICK
ncbi:uncharacterized protein B0P05DRAFT_564821, partial [Gilbertella persicaria]|uniref:uncharacterized protein n=1 Tax=Gilbertella persicaria TaxID=101096 RepID=UPI0022209E2B